MSRISMTANGSDMQLKNSITAINHQTITSGLIDSFNGWHGFRDYK